MTFRPFSMPPSCSVAANPGHGFPWPGCWMLNWFCSFRRSRLRPGNAGFLSCRWRAAWSTTWSVLRPGLVLAALSFTLSGCGICLLGNGNFSDSLGRSQRGDLVRALSGQDQVRPGPGRFGTSGVSSFSTGRCLAVYGRPISLGGLGDAPRRAN